MLAGTGQRPDCEELRAECGGEDRELGGPPARFSKVKGKQGQGVCTVEHVRG